MSKSKLLTVCATIWVAAAHSNAVPYLSPKLDSISQTGGISNSKHPVLIFFESSASTELSKAAMTVRIDRSSRLKAVHRSLLQSREQGHRPLESYLNSQGIRFSQLWIVPAYMAVVSPEELRAITAIDGVKEIIEDAPLIFDNPVKSEPAPALATAVSSQLAQLNVPALWNRGLRGRGRLVCSFDTGVEGGHPALASKWRGTHAPLSQAWFSKVSPDSLPGDRSGHGTHTMGIMVGHDGADTIGVAPGAEWITAGIIDQGRPLGTTISDILEAFQWALNPDSDTSTTDDVPDVILNSWGIPKGLFSPCDATFWAAIDNVEAAGVVTIFAAGNEGPGPRTLRSPADRASTPYNSFSVGAVDPALNVTTFSSRGPSSCDTTQVKPELVAPGQSIRSSFKGGTYQLMTGTSMAAPYIAGIVALLREYNPDATVEEIKDAIIRSTIDLGPMGEDNAYGYGFPDAARALEFMPIPQSVTVTPYAVTIGGDGIALPGELTDLTISLSNPAGNVISLSALLESDGPVSVLNSDCSYLFGSGGTLAVNLEPFQFRIHDSVTHGEQIPCRLILLSSQGDPFDTLEVDLRCGIAPPGALATQNSPTVAFSSSEFGQFGLGPGSIYSSGGVGLRRGAGRNLLYEAGLVVGRSALQLATSVRGANGGFRESDFRATELITTYASSGGTTITETEFADLEADIEIPITVRQTTTTFSSGDESDAIVLSFTLQNTSLSKLTGLSFGFLADFDDTTGNEICGYNDDLGVIWQNLGDQFIGVVHLSSIRGMRTLSNGQGKTGFTNGELFALAQEVGFSATADPGDQMVFVSAGSFTLMPGDSQPLVLAMVVGETMDDLFASVAALRLRLDTPTDAHGGGGAQSLPDNIMLAQNYPNPFNPTTAIEFSLPRTTAVRLDIYNLMGQRVRTLLDATLPSGNHTTLWDGRNQEGSPVASGVYLYRLSTPTGTTTRRMTLLK